MARALILAAVALTCLGGCNRPRWDTPVDAYLSFARAVQKGEFKVAYGALSEPTQKLLAAQSAQISRASGGAVRDDPASLFFLEASVAPQVSEVKLVRQDGDSAVVAVTAADQTREVRMVREQGGWRIDLVDAVRP